MMSGLLQDLRYAFRMLVKAPGFTIAAVCTLALGIGANVAMFSVVYGVLLRSLPYRDAGRLVLVRAEGEYAGTHRPVSVFLQPNDLASWQQPIEGLSSVAFYATSVHALAGTGESEVVPSAIVSGSFFATMSGPVVAGRGLGPGDDLSASAVISERLARRLFGDPAAAIGRAITLTARPYTVIGVADPAFQFPTADLDVWLPAGFERSVSRCCGFRVVGRLAADSTIDRARAAVQPLFGASSAATSAKGRAAEATVRARVVRLADEIVSPVRPALLILFAAVLLVLFVACSNLINLLLARNAGREREFAVRLALGASAGRLVRQLLAETALLTAIGTACGLLIAQASLIGLARWMSAALPRADSLRLDPMVLLFAAAIAALAAIGTGLIPALRALPGAGGGRGGRGGGSSNALLSLQGTANTATPRRTRRLQRAMCVVQVAIALTLMIGATLLGRSLVRLINVDLGVSRDHVLTASINLAFGEHPNAAQTTARIDRLMAHIQIVPGVRAVGVGTSVPPAASRIRLTLKRHGDDVDYQATGVPATPGYFAALRTRLVKGRLFTEADDEHHPQVMIMSEDTARRFFGEADPIGRTMVLPVMRDGHTTSADMTLVGIIANVAYAGLGAPPDDAVYRPFAQQPFTAPFLVVRTVGDPADFATTLRREIAVADKGIVTTSVATLDQLVADAAAQPQVRTVLLIALAALALGIAAVGLYGVVAYSVSQRSREIGIRLALGATSQDMVAMVLRDGVMVATVGIAIGVASGFALSRVLAGMLYGITPGDPASFLLASIGLLALTLIASYIPARRAARTDPIRALRAE
jgi:putative ABC transport system permease protein